ncbi:MULTISPECIES: DUF1441 family protein [Rahnella]|uniref:DUF1441 family protein n=1 Tax=Rahnella sp. (strain Y9602) TaxID=2703885 RepID=A0ABW6CPX1_RAHSY|nr:phage terminase Nu1 subunit (DNA packaging protein) [Rahnella aquatilis]
MTLGNTLVNVSQLADLVGMHRNMVARRLREIELAGGNGENLKLYELSTALKTLIMPSVRVGGEMSPQDRKAWYQSENERLKFEQANGELIPAEDVAREFAVMSKAVVQVLETLPDVLERDLALSPSVVTRVQNIIDDLRDEMARRVFEAEIEDQ